MQDQIIQNEVARINNAQDCSGELEVLVKKDIADWLLNQEKVFQSEQAMIQAFWSERLNK